MIPEVAENEVEDLLEKGKQKGLLLQLRSIRYNRNFKSVGGVIIGICLVTIICFSMNPIQKKHVVPLAESLSNQNLIGRDLEFVQITETGGLYLTWAAYNWRGILWGVCHFISEPNIGCDSPDIVDNEGKAGHSPWLLPPTRLHPAISPYKGAHLFTVVRNPYDRIIAEYYNRWIGNKNGNRNQPEAMNQFLRENLNDKEGNFLSHNHYIPQSEYVFDKRGRQIVDHVLHYENLDEEFKMLTDAYGLDIEIDWTLLPREDVVIKELGVDDLSSETIQMINEYAREDFELFGYEMKEIVTDIESSKDMSF